MTELQNEEPKWLKRRYVSSGILYLSILLGMIPTALGGLCFGLWLRSLGLPDWLTFTITITPLIAWSVLWGWYSGIAQFFKAIEEGDPKIWLVRQFPKWSREEFRFATLFNICGLLLAIGMMSARVWEFLFFIPINVIALLVFGMEWWISREKEQMSEFVRLLIRLMLPFWKEVREIHLK